MAVHEQPSPDFSLVRAKHGICMAMLVVVTVVMMMMMMMMVTVMVN